METSKRVGVFELMASTRKELNELLTHMLDNQRQILYEGQKEVTRDNLDSVERMMKEVTTMVVEKEEYWL